MWLTVKFEKTRYKSLPIRVQFVHDQLIDVVIASQIQFLLHFLCTTSVLQLTNEQMIACNKHSNIETHYTKNKL